MSDREVEKEIMMYLPAVVGWIEKGDDITEADVRHLKDAVPEHLNFGLISSFEDVVKLNEGYVEDPIWKEYVAVILSDRGKNWLKKNLKLLKEFSKVQ